MHIYTNWLGSVCTYIGSVHTLRAADLCDDPLHTHPQRPNGIVPLPRISIWTSGSGWTIHTVRSGQGWYRSLIINKTICMNTVVSSASTRAGRPCLAVVEYTGAHEGAGEMAPFCPLSLLAWGRSEGEDHSLCILNPD